AINLSIDGVGTSNFDISNNGTAAQPLANTQGVAIAFGAFGNVTAIGTINNNFIDSHSNVNGQPGMAFGVDQHFAVTDAPVLTITADNNTIKNTQGNGILATARSSNGTLKATITNNNVAAPLAGVRPGIRVDSGNNTTGENTKVVVDIENNTSAGSGGTNGIGLRKQGTSTTVDTFSVVGMTATSSPGVESYVSGLNPNGNGVLLISATSGFSNGSIPTAGTLSLSALSPSSATVGTSFNQTISASGGNGTSTFSLVSGSLPAGITLSSGGVLSGTPTAGGSFSFTVAATDTSTPTGSGRRAYTLTVNAPTITFTPASLAGGTVGAAYSQTISASGSTTPFHFTISSGSLPPGLFLNQDTGVISGVPTTASGSPFSFTVQAADSSTGTGPFSNTKNYSISVASPTVSLRSIPVR